MGIGVITGGGTSGAALVEHLAFRARSRVDDEACARSRLGECVNRAAVA